MLHIDVDFIDRLAKACKKFPDQAVNIMQSVKKNQMISKRQIFGHLPDHACVCVMGGWFGIPYLLANPTCTFTFVDLDPMCAEIGRYIWKDRTASFITGDALRFDVSNYDVVINTSTEHMVRSDLEIAIQRIPANKWCLLQNSNQRNVLDHKNCFDTQREFVEWVEGMLIVKESKMEVMDNGSQRFTAICMSA